MFGPYSLYGARHVDLRMYCTCGLCFVCAICVKTHTQKKAKIHKNKAKTNKNKQKKKNKKKNKMLIAVVILRINWKIII